MSGTTSVLRKDTDMQMSSGDQRQTEKSNGRQAVGKRHFLIAVWMAGGLATLYHRLKKVIGSRDDITTSWVPIELHPKDLIARIPPMSWNGSLANSMVTRSRIRSLEKAGARFDAALYVQHSIVTFLRGFRKRVPYVLTMDGTPMYYAKHGLWYAHPAFDPDSISARWKKNITRSVYAGAFHLLPFSEGVKESLVEDYGIPEEKVTVLPPGVDMKRYVVPSRHERPGKDDSYRLKVLFVGADFPRKGGDLLASLAGREEFANLDFHFVTKSLVRPVGKNVVVHSELSIDSNELIALYRDADIFVLPTRADSHSLAMLEAMAVGLPAISTKVGALDEIIIEGETGFLLPPDDIHGLANRLHTLVENPSLRLAMGRNARKRAEEHFNLAKNAEVILTMLEQAAMTGGSRRLT